MTAVLILLLCALVFGVLCWIADERTRNQEVRTERRRRMRELERWYDQEYSSDPLDIYALNL